MAGNEGQKANNSGQTRTEQRTTPARGSTQRAAAQPASAQPAAAETTTEPGQQSGTTTSQNGHEDPNAIVQLAEALTQQLQAIARANSESSGYSSSSSSHGSTTSTTTALLDAQQTRLTIRYGALSNLLGNFGRHGTPRTGIIEPPPILFDNEHLDFAAPIPGAFTVVTFDFGGNLLQRIPFDNDGVDVQHGDQIQTVEIENKQGISFLFGFVVRQFSEEG
jgi:hypothetical protein